MLVRELMTKTLTTIDAGTTLNDAAQLMHELDVGILPVRESGVARGVLTDRDIVVRALAKKMDPATTQVREILTPRVHSVLAEQDVSVAAEIMASQQVRRLVVLDEGQNAVGVLSLGDVSRAGFRDITGTTAEGVNRDSTAEHQEAG